MIKDTWRLSIKIVDMSEIGFNIQDIVKRFDLFRTSNYLRYKGAAEYTTLTGGVCSLAVIFLFVILFASMGSLTLQKKIIFSSATTSFDSSPSAVNITMSPEGGFMFGVVMLGFNLGDSDSRLFNFELLDESYTPFLNLEQRKMIPLVPCTEQHFNFTTKISKMVNQFNLSQGLCPALGATYEKSAPISSGS
jgi:hypothetical protein